MNSKILNYSKKLIAILVIVLLCSSSTVQAFSFGTQNTGTTSGGIRSLINRSWTNEKFWKYRLK